MRLPIIDADGHVMEPFALWQERLPAQYRDMAWRRVTVDGVERVEFYGHATRFEWSLGSLCTPGSLRASGRLDIDLETEVDTGTSDPHRRLSLMDAQGIALSVLFPTMTLGLDDLPDQGFVNASAHAYNEWIRDFAAADPIRLRWAAVLPLTDLEWAAAELEWAIGEGATTVMLSPIPTPAGQSLAHSTWSAPTVSTVSPSPTSAGSPEITHWSRNCVRALRRRSPLTSAIFS